VALWRVAKVEEEGLVIWEQWKLRKILARKRSKH